MAPKQKDEANEPVGHPLARIFFYVEALRFEGKQEYLHVEGFFKGDIRRWEKYI